MKLFVGLLMMMGIVKECVGLEKVELSIHEGSANFKEKIFVDVSGNYEIIKVPQHNNLSALEIFIDYQKGYRIEKIISERQCMVMKLDKSDGKPMDLVNGVKHAHNKFPTSSYTVVHESILTTGKVDLKSPIGKTAAQFCGTGMDIQHAVSYVGEDMNGFATQLLRNAAEKKNEKRDMTPLQEDFRCCAKGCDLAKGQKEFRRKLNICNGNQMKMVASCKINTNPRGCVYRVLCPYDSAKNKGYWVCTSKHIFKSFVCCDFTCKK